MNLIDKDALVAEIKKRYKFLERKKEFNSHNTEYEIRMSECQHLALILNTIKTKDVNLEKEIKHFAMSKELYEADSAIKAVAEHFYELGLNTQKGE